MRTRRKNNIEAENIHRDRWLISYADLVTLLLALFIVMYAAADHDRAKKIAESFNGQNSGDGVLPANDGEKDKNSLTEKILLDNPVLLQKTKIRQSERGLIVSLSEAGFFAPGDNAISSEAENVIKTLADSLQSNQVPIRIEGHTYSTPISTARYSSNWELSTARASSVLQEFVKKGIAPERLSAAGYGGFQPVADNASPEGRAQNRRVDVVILNR